MEKLNSLNGLRVVALDDAKILFSDENGEFTQSVSLSVGRHDLSRYNVLLEHHFDLQNMQVVSQQNAAETMTYPTEVMLKSSANPHFKPMFSPENLSPMEKRYASQVTQMVEKNRENRANQERDRRVHDALLRFKQGQRQEEQESERRKLELKAARRAETQAEKELIEDGEIPKQINSIGQNIDGSNSDSAEVVKLDERRDTASESTDEKSRE